VSKGLKARATAEGANMPMSEKNRLDFLFAEVGALKYFVGLLLASEGTTNPQVEKVLREIASGNPPKRYIEDLPADLPADKKKIIDDVEKRESAAIVEIAKEFHRLTAAMRKAAGSA
jgi:hypothetical protein